MECFNLLDETLLQTIFKNLFTDRGEDRQKNYFNFAVVCKTFYEISNETKFKTEIENIIFKENFKVTQQLRYLKEEYEEQIEFGYDRNINTLLITALKRFCYDCINILLNHGADINTKDEKLNGATPLMISIQRRDLKMIKFLLNLKNIDTNQPNSDCYSPLMYASQYTKGSDLTVVKLLVEDFGADINYTTKYGDSALMRYISKRYTFGNGNALEIAERLNYAPIYKMLKKNMKKKEPKKKKEIFEFPDGN